MVRSQKKFCCFLMDKYMDDTEKVNAVQGMAKGWYWNGKEIATCGKGMVKEW